MVALPLGRDSPQVSTALGRGSQSQSGMSQEYFLISISKCCWLGRGEYYDSCNQPGIGQSATKL